MKSSKRKINWKILMIVILYGLLIIPLFKIMYVFRIPLESVSRFTPYLIIILYLTLPFYFIDRFSKKVRK